MDILPPNVYSTPNIRHPNQAGHGYRGNSVSAVTQETMGKDQQTLTAEPTDQGSLCTALPIYKHCLDQLNYLNAHPKDLFLNLIQIILAALLLFSPRGHLISFQATHGHRSLC